MLNGGGGTAFEPAFEALANLRVKPDIVVFGTDGYGSYPEEPKDMDVIWLCINGEILVDWGETIELTVGDDCADDDDC